MFAPFALLTIALLALWLRARDGAGGGLGRVLWAGALSGAVIAALITGVAQPIALLWIGGVAGAAWTFARPQTGRWLRRAAIVALVVLAAGLMAHQLPGFHNPRVIDGALFSRDALPFRLHLNFDKPFIGLFLLAWCHPLMRRGREWRDMARAAAPVAAGLIFAVMLLALTTGYVRFEPKFPRESWLWLWVNLCFTCVAEEAFFRGFLQAQLQRRWQAMPRGKPLALGIAAALFGVAHAAGGADVCRARDGRGRGLRLGLPTRGRTHRSEHSHPLRAQRRALFLFHVSGARARLRHRVAEV